MRSCSRRASTRAEDTAGSSSRTATVRLFRFRSVVSRSTPHRGVAGGLCPYTKMGPTGAQTPHQDYMNGRDNASCPTLDFCPFNTYRISGDIVRRLWAV